jgi:hypothetical protein
VTDKTRIGFTWEDGVSDGGTAVLDWRITYDQSTGNNVILEAGITQRSYTTSIVLTAGRYYVFKVEARNAVGYSLVS